MKQLPMKPPTPPALALVSMLGLLAIAPSMKLRSTSFADNSTFARAFVCRQMGGENRSPELQWSAPPAGTRSFALVVHDPDAPAPGGWWHWAIYNIPPSARGIAMNGAAPGVVAFGSSRERRYNGPCPPPGKLHHYHFTLYALSVARLGGSSILDARSVARLAGERAIARARLTGLFRNPTP